MKKRLAILILILVAVLVASAPVSAAREWVGEQIILVDGSSREFAAGEPFHIKHGWVNLSPSDRCLNGWDFHLMVSDPMLDRNRGQIYIEPIEGSGHPPKVVKQHVYQYREGMIPAVVTFIGVWYAPCQAAVEAGWWTEPCRYFCQPVPVHSRSTTVTFTE